MPVRSQVYVLFGLGTAIEKMQGQERYRTMVCVCMVGPFCLIAAVLSSSLHGKE